MEGGGWREVWTEREGRREMEGGKEGDGWRYGGDGRMGEEGREGGGETEEGRVERGRDRGTDGRRWWREVWRGGKEGDRRREG